MNRLGVADLHRNDWGAHIHLLEEWNESVNFWWLDATLVPCMYGEDLTVVHPFTTSVGSSGDRFPVEPDVAIATYTVGGEGEITNLIVLNHSRRKVEVLIDHDNKQILT